MKEVSDPPIIALITDFGTRDYFVGAMKGVILSINQNAQIIDITHEIEAQNIKSAGFTLNSCYRNFPEKTIFAAVVDPGVGSNRKAILVETEHYFFVAPDNGLLSFVLNEAENMRVYELTNEKFFLPNVSRTFHGRDMFAPVAAHLSRGVEANEFGAETNDFVRFVDSKPRRVSEKEIEAEIIYIDRFDNLITNLKSEDVPEKFVLHIGEFIVDKFRHFYAEAERGEVFLIIGSAENVEIAAFRDSAARMLKAEIGTTIQLEEL
jgi:hypothetical protein